MKAQFLKIAKCKDEKSFYKKYPTQEAFFKAHPEARSIKKAEIGAYIGGDTMANAEPISYQTYYDDADKLITGFTEKERQEATYKEQELKANKASSSGMEKLLGMIGGGAPGGEEEGGMPDMGMGRNGKYIPRAYGGEEVPGGYSGGYYPPPIDASLEGSPGYQYQQAHDAPSGGGGAGFLNNALKAVPIVGGLISGIQGLKAEKEAAKAAKQQKTVSGLQLTASATRPEQIQRRYVRPEDVSIQPNQMFPTYGVGTNVLARDGEIIRRAQSGTSEAGSVDIAPEIPGGMMGRAPMIPEVDALMPIKEKPSNFDSKSARDNWVQKTGLPWSEAKRLGYTNGSAKDNTKLLSELNDPRFKKENLRREAPKSKSQGRTPVQHTDTPTGRLTPIKKPLTMDEYFKGKPKYKPSKSNIGVPDEGNMVTRIGERLANPLQTFANYAKYRELPPEGFSKYSKNAFDQVLALRNPAYWANAVGNASDYASEEEYKKAVIEAAEALPALGKLKYTKYIPYEKGLPAAREFVRRAGYLGEGAKRIGTGAAKQLPGNAAKQIGPGYVPNFTMYRSGGEIQNTYAPGYLYDNLGYEPLNDSNVKQYYRGGDIPKAQGGFSNYMNSLSGGGSGFSGAGEAGSTPWGAIGSTAAGMTGETNAGGNIGGTVGGALGSAFGPAGNAVGTFVGTIAGNALDPYAKAIKRDTAATKRNIENIAYNKMAPGLIAPYQAHARNGRNIANYEEGGYMNPEYNPQVIASFGGLSEQEVYDYAHDGMQSLRAGGHIRGEYTPISNRGMEQYAMGGEVKTTWGGHAETISHNPYMPGTGETIMFRGKSHDESDGNGNTGIGVKYGKGAKDSYTDYAEYGTQEADADVEVERGEPAAELQDANGEKNLTVYGNLKIPNQYIDLLGDPNAKGKKFKNYVNDLSKIEAKQNKIVESSTNKLNALNPQTQFDKLKLTSLQASIEGANMKLKDIASKKMNAAYLQNAINDTAEENGLVADDLARGRVKVDKEALQEYAEYGKTIKKAETGTTIDNEGKKITKAERQRLLKSGEYKVDPSNPKNIYRVKSKSATSEQKKSASALGYIPKGQSVDPTTGLSNKITKKEFEDFKNNNKWYDWSKFDAKDPNAVNDAANKFNEKAKEIGSDARILPDKDGKVTIVGQQYISGKLEDAKQETPGSTEADYLEVEDEDKVYDVNAQKRNPWLDLAGQVLPFFRPTDQEGLDYDQLMGEMYALSSNQLEPVQAQGYQPDLATPYDISYQDQLNANQADYNATQKMVGYNPAAQSILNAQKYAANTGVLGEQFRANQAMKMGVYDQNRQTLNDAKLKNLSIFDQQYTRQEQAKSNTKAVTQAALNSISDKYAKNKLENRELGIYENLYNYRYDPSGRAINMNAPWQANIPNMYNKGNQTANMREVYDKQGNFLRYEPIGQTQTTTDDTLDAAGRTTGIGDKKNGGKIKYKNGSIVSSYKNL